MGNRTIFKLIIYDIFMGRKPRGKDYVLSYVVKGAIIGGIIGGALMVFSPNQNERKYAPMEESTRGLVDRIMEQYKPKLPPVLEGYDFASIISL